MKTSLILVFMVKNLFKYTHVTIKLKTYSVDNKLQVHEVCTYDNIYCWKMAKFNIDGSHLEHVNNHFAKFE